MIEKRQKKDLSNVLAFHQLWFLCSWPERFLVAIGILSSVAVGLTVPLAVYLIGEVVTLFITNRRGRLAILHFKNNFTNLPLEGNADISFVRDNVSLPSSKNAINYQILNIGKEALYVNDTIHEILNTSFSTYLFTISVWMIYTSAVQLIGGFLAQSMLNLVAERQVRRINRILQKLNVQNCCETSGDANTSLLMACTYPEALRLLRAGSGACVGTVISSFITLLSCLGLAFYRRWELALMLTPILPLTIIGRRLVNRLHKTQSRQIAIAQSRAKSHVQEVFDARRTVIAFGGENREIQSYYQYLTEILHPIKKRAKYLGIGNGTVVMATHTLNALMLWFGVQLMMNDNRQEEPFLPGTPVVVSSKDFATPESLYERLKVFFSFMRGVTVFIQAFPAMTAVQLAKDSAQRLIKHFQKHTEDQPKGYFESNLLLKGISVPTKKEMEFQKEDRTKLDCMRKHPKKRKKKMKEKKKITQKIDIKSHLKAQFFYLSIGSLSSILLGIAVPSLFYIFCEIIGAMANLDEELVLDKSLYNSGIYLVLGTTTFFATYYQKSTIDTGAACFGNKLKREILTNILKQKLIWFLEDDEMNKIDNLLNKEVGKLEQVIRSVFGGGLQMTAGVIACIPIGLSVVWKQAAVLTYSIPALMLLHTLKIWINSLWKKRSERRAKDFVAIPILADAFLNGILSSQREFLLGTILIYGGTLIVNEGVGNKDVLQVNLVMINSVLLIGQAVQAITDCKAGIKALRKINKWVCQRRDEAEVGFIPTSEDIHRNKGILEFQNLSAWHKNNSSTLFKVDLKAEPGQCIIIVGESSKFETLMEILLKVRKATEGALLIDGYNIEKIPDSIIRNKVRVVSAHLPFFEGRSIMDNISYGEKIYIEEFPNAVMKAAKQAGIHEVISKLSQDYNTHLTGINNKISETQMKKLMLARALFTKPKVLIVEINNKEEEVLIEESASLADVCLFLMNEIPSCNSSARIIHLKSELTSNEDVKDSGHMIVSHLDTHISMA